LDAQIDDQGFDLLTVLNWLCDPFGKGASVDFSASGTPFDNGLVIRNN
jgi:hypothetical protein